MASDASSPGAERARKASEGFRTSMDGIRDRADATAKVFGGIATAAIGALGYERLADFFPYSGPGGWLLVAIAGVVAMVVAAWLLVWRFRRASYAVITSADENETFVHNEIAADRKVGRWTRLLEAVAGDRCPERERQLVTDAYRAVAQRNGQETLGNLEEAGRAAEVAAESGGNDAGQKAFAERVLAEVQMAQDRAATLLLRRRSTTALFSGRTVIFISIFILGWYAAAAGADAIEAERTESKDAVELTKTCAETRKALGFADVDLPAACDDLATRLSSTEYRKATGAAVDEARAACLQDATGDPAATKQCESIALVKEKEAEASP